jgi:hypothetical protein
VRLSQATPQELIQARVDEEVPALELALHERGSGLLAPCLHLLRADVRIRASIPDKAFQGAGPDSGEVTDIAIDPSDATDRTPCGQNTGTQRIDNVLLWILVMADKKNWLQLLAYVTDSINQELLLERVPGG